jgi:acyl-CoA synthetase (NDP forming)
MLFLHLSPLRGRRTLLLGGGGGNSVAMADICSRDGLEVPPLSDNTRKQLAEFIPLAGNSIRNPLDVWMVQNMIELFRRCIEIAVADPVIDLVIVDSYAGEDDDDRPDREEQQRQVNDFITDFAKKNPFNKPVVVAMNTLNHDPNNTAMTAKLRVQFALAGVPAYASQANATRALARFIRYHEFQARNRD